MTIAPIAPADLERSLRGLGESTMFPSAAYIDPGTWGREAPAGQHLEVVERAR